MHKGSVAGFAVLIALAVSPINRTSSTVETDRHQAFAWFDTLGFGDRLSKPFVRVQSRNLDRDNRDSETDPPQYGFLIAETPKGFTILALGLHQRTYERKTSYSVSQYQVADFADHARAELKKRSKPTEEELDDGPWNGPDGMVELFVYSRVADAQGSEDLSKRFFLLSQAAQSHKEKPFFDDLKKEVGDGVVSEISYDMGNLDIPRKGLIARLKEFIRLYPKHEESSLANRWIRDLTQMEVADNIRASRPGRSFESMSDSDKIDELIYQLQDQNGETWMNPGSCDVFADPRGEKSPANQLSAMGYKAVPKLIEALKDKRLSRSIESGTRWISPDRVLCVGEVAFQVIEKILSRRFEVDITRNNSRWAQHWTQVYDQIRSYWAVFQSQGEKRVLIEAVRKGDGQNPQLIRLLAEKYPADAPAAIATGLKKAKDSSTACEMIVSLGQCRNQEAKALALRYMRLGSTLPIRVSAATVVAQTDFAKAVAAMEREWIRLGPKSEYGAGQLLMSFLLANGTAGSVDLVRKNLKKLDVDDRVELAGMFDQGSIPPSVATYFSMMDLPKTGGNGLKRYRESVERLLIAELDDTERRYGASMSGPFGDFDSPRVCDLIAYDLSVLWPKKYRFRNSISSFQMETQRIESMNTWRRSQGLHLLNVPQKTKIPLASSATLTPLIAAVVSARDSSSRSHAIARIGSLGLSALPEVSRKVESLPNDHPARQDLVKLASLLACTVSEVHVTGSPVPSTIRGELMRVQDKPLTSNGFVKILRTMDKVLRTRNLDSVVNGVREGDGTGFVISIDFHASRKHRPEGQVDTIELLRVGSSRPFNCGSAGSGWAPQDSDALIGTRRRFHRALASNPNELISFAYTEEWYSN